MEELYAIKMEWLRYQMIQLAKEKGLNDPAVLRVSQQVDQLHNKLNQLQHEAKISKKKVKNETTNGMYLKEENIHPYIALPI